MLSTILYIYLAGWLTMSSVGVYNCHKDGGNHVVSPGLCDVYVITYVGPMWPKFGYIMLKGDD